MISDVYFPRVNGVSTSIETFRRQFLQLGHEVKLIAPDYGDAQAADNAVMRIPAMRVPFDPEDRLMGWCSINRQIGATSDGAYDLVHVHTPFMAHYFGVKLARKMHLPCVESYHTYFEEYFHHYVPVVPRSVLRRLSRAVSRRQCESVDALVVPSSAMLETLRAYGIRRPMEIIATGINVSEFGHGDGVRFRRSNGIPVARPTLIHVGRVAWEKNIQFLIRVLAAVAKEIPDVQMIIAGEGPALPTLKRLARQLGVRERVYFAGYQRRDGALQDCYAAGDLFVFSSNTETQGLVLLEAMALGVPVVSTAEMGTKDILSSGRGALIAREDIDDFKEKIVRLLRDATLRAKLSSEGRQLVQGWAQERCAQKMLAFYERVMDSFPGAARK